MLPFNRPPVSGSEIEHIKKAIELGSLCGDGAYTHKCQQWFESYTGSKKALLTPSCTAALEMTAILIDIQPGDEVIMPSYTFVSTANAFVLRGAKIVFVDIRRDTMNIDEMLIEEAITDKTKAIVPVHYAGVACEMDSIMALAEQYGLYVIEDAAQGVMSSYKGRALGSIGHLAAFSFHETKNYTSGGEGGLLLINDETFVERAQIIREKGTNRSQFFRGMVDKYSWVDLGSSFLPSELQAAYLWGQILHAEDINQDRLNSWKKYYADLQELELKGSIELPKVPTHNAHNAHMFYIRTKNLSERTQLIAHLKQDAIQATFHYVPLHSAKAAEKFASFYGVDRFTTSESDKLVRLPMWYGLSASEVDAVVASIKRFYSKP